MSLPTITASDALRLLAAGATLVDVREADEHARERAPGAVNAPLSRLDDAQLPDGIVIFHCKSGARTMAAAPRLAAKAGQNCEAYVVDGGLEALRRAGAPVERHRTQPLELQRQVQIGVGSLVVAGVVLAVGVSPWFMAVPAFAGAGLIVAGVTGFCGLARVLARAPWNRRAGAGPAKA